MRLIIYFVALAHATLDPVDPSGCPHRCSSVGECYGWLTEPYFPPFCICKQGYEGVGCEFRQPNPWVPSQAKEVPRYKQWAQTQGVACGERRFAKQCSSCPEAGGSKALTNMTLRTILCGGECRLGKGSPPVCGPIPAYLPWRDIESQDQFGYDGKGKRGLPLFGPTGRFGKGRGRAPLPCRGRVPCTDRSGRSSQGTGKFTSPAVQRRIEMQKLRLDQHASTKLGKQSGGIVKRFFSGRGSGAGAGGAAGGAPAAKLIATAVGKDGAPSAGGSNSATPASRRLSSVFRRQPRGRGRGGGAAHHANAQSCALGKGFYVLGVGGSDGSEAQQVSAQLGRLTGEDSSYLHAASVAQARAAWPALLQQQPRLRALILMPHVSVLRNTSAPATTSASAATASTSTSAASAASTSAATATPSTASLPVTIDLADLLRELGSVRGGTLQLLTPPLTAGLAGGEAAEAAGEVSGAARRARALPKSTMRVARVAARLGGAHWLDASTALLSAPRSTKAGAGSGRGGDGMPAPKLLGGLLASALTTQCGLLWPAVGSSSGGGVGGASAGSSSSVATSTASVATSTASTASTASAASAASAASTASTASTAGGGSERCAVCFSGWMGVSVANGGGSLASHLIRPLQAETLLALTYHPSDGCDSMESCRVAERLPALKPYAATAMAPMLPLPRLLEIMEGLPHWPAIMRAYSRGGSRVHCERASNESASSLTGFGGPSPYRCKGIYLGNTIFAPVLGSYRLHVLRQLHDIRRCLGLPTSREAAAGWMYDRIIHTRLEFVWLRPHPSLHLLSPHAVWIPSGEDYYGGVNDRHAVLSRAAAEVYMRRWDLIADGTILKLDHQLL